MPITLVDVSYIYMKGTPYERTAIQRINLTIDRGEFVGIIGHTGSGKSTLVQHLNGLLKPVSGEVCIDGININAKTAEAKTARRKVGMVFQYPEHQLFEETVYADIAFGPRNYGLTELEVEQRVRKALAFVGLNYEEFAKRSPFQLSGGQMRRVAIAGVIALEPEYLVLDEPSAGLDPRGREEIFNQIIDLHKKTGVAVILVSHNMEDIARMANRLIVMNCGSVILEGAPREVFRHKGDILQSAGVDVPQITALFSKLQARGMAVDNSAITVEDAVNDILRAVRRQGRCSQT